MSSQGAALNWHSCEKMHTASLATVLPADHIPNKPSPKAKKARAWCGYLGCD